MPIRQLTFPCKVCSAMTPHNQKTPNHVLHALLTLFLFGFWLPVWITVAVLSNNAPITCVQCGTQRLLKK